ncbi:adenylate/guanylate cyclase domain-containing protein [Mycobacterium sp. TY815]|uniref:adenylate/guanylate cyclase domain-containing protein n=1 Tax=Mycobacterium sp. TY815 TaxID=3050581 RepID=UPI0027422406|nr:adenylate/guanylate cyclase domain-containing protein [Mycobacterium sp. TY815]MDP7702041.1 adenylate/guanylate cyclase domain-containing protein [Mycobacterium sp. TY815]
MGRRKFPVPWTTRALLVLAALFPNVLGAAVIGVTTFWALPTGQALSERRILHFNVVVMAVYVAVAAAIAIVCGLLATTYRSGGDEAPSASEARKRVLMAIPLRTATIHGAVWVTAGVILVVINLRAPWLATTLGVSVLLGSFVTTAVAYWLCTRILRPFVAEVLTDSPPTSARGPGLRLRAVSAWTLGTGVPLLQLLLVGASALVIDYSGRRLAIVVLVLGGCAAVSGLAITAFTGAVSADPIDEVRRGMQRVERGDLDATVPVFEASELGLLQAGFNTMAAGLRDRERLRDLFGRHVGRDVARLAEQGASDNGALGGVNCEAAALFVDLVGSSRLAERMAPEDLVAMLNEFFAVVVEIVERHRGLVNKFEGDAALAIFGAPVELNDCAGAALAAARELGRQLNRSEIRAGIGVSAGTVVAGNIGESRRYEYTVIGDPVNEAARLTEVAKQQGGVAASGAALARASQDEAQHWRVFTTTVLRGRDSSTEIVVPAANSVVG